MFDTDYVEGETAGYDTFLPVDPSVSAPGSDRVNIINAVNNIDLLEAYDAPAGDRIILGTAESPLPFYTRGADGQDNDFAVVTNFDYRNGHIQLRGSAADYGLIRCTTADGCDTDGFYLFHTATGTPDLVAFIFPCDDIALPISGNPPANPRALCNSDSRLSLTNSAQFRFATPLPVTPSLASVAAQIGTSGKEIIGGTTVDAAGNHYLLGATDGSFASTAVGGHRIVVRQLRPDRSPGWVFELPLSDGSLLFDAASDGTHLYVVGRTLSALPGFTNRGRWDAIILKLRISDGALVASTQFGNEGLDGFGNVVLDDAGNLFVSGSGSPAGATGTDDSHLVAKYRTADLARVWNQIVPPAASGRIFVSEAWGGLSYVPGASPGNGRLIAGGWFMTAGGSDGFLEVWDNLSAANPARTANAVISSGGTQADWILDNAVDAAGNIYAVGFTTGQLGSQRGGQGDAFVARFDPQLQNPVYLQLGTTRSDQLRKLDIASDGTLFALGYTYGDFNGSTNADRTFATGDVLLAKIDRNLSLVSSITFGTSGEERGYLALAGSSLFVGGMTEGSLATGSRGSFDFFATTASTSSLALR
ncbi:hypothetical protein WAB17_13755 [Parerythrobacter aurantius]|uniref:hypothetical protein n=1 Tax=Parerythrobacter aurantius TaxID=3127706 RepID=UPI00324ABEF5